MMQMIGQSGFRILPLEARATDCAPHIPVGMKVALHGGLFTSLIVKQLSKLPTSGATNHFTSAKTYI